MLATDDRLALNDYGFNNSPESSSDHSYSTDFMEVTSDEDFLTQLSSDLDIPLFLNPGEDEMSMLNSFFDKSPDEILSEISSPTYSKDDEPIEELSIEMDELQHLDYTLWGPESFPNLKSEVKSELDSSSSTDSIKSVSPVQIHSPAGPGGCEIIKEEVQIKTPPISPKPVILQTDVNNFAGATREFVYAQPVTIVPQNQNGLRLSPKPVNIVPKMPYTKPVSHGNKVIMIKKSDIKNTTPIITNSAAGCAPKVVVLENIRSVPVSNVALPQLPVSPPVSNVQTVTMPSMVVKGNNSYCLGMESNIDPKLFKRQQRKIKNRESACLSRKKKKDYLTGLEEKVKELTEENERLQEENMLLRERLSLYEESPSSKTRNLNKNIKQSLVLCIFLLVVGVNLDFIRNPFSSRTELDLIQKNPPKLMDHHGRGLLWATEEKEDAKNKSSNFSPFFMCPATINQTESARLVLELERWIGKPVDLSSKTNLHKNTTQEETPSKLKVRKKKYKMDSPMMSTIYRRDKYRTDRQLDIEARNEIQVFSPTPEQMYSEFFEAINRQYDTFYVVSFTDQHLLLPALNHNKTRRPKMSLIMPSMLPNGSVPQTSLIPLMQIDCEVLDTRLIHIKPGAVPQHLRKYGNTTKEQPVNSGDVSNSSNNENKFYKKPYKPYFINNSAHKPNGLFYKLH